MIRAATKWARAARAMVMAMRVAGNNEGENGKNHGLNNVSGVQQSGRWQQGWRASNGNKGNGNGNGNNMGNGNGGKAGG